ncbi:MAG: peptide-binding protein [Planctomycetota bacterium]
MWQLGCGKTGAPPPEESPPPAEAPPGEGPAESPPGESPTEPPAPSAPDDPVAKAMEGANPPAVVDDVITDGGTLINRFRAEPDTLNFLTGRDAYGSAIQGLINDSLIGRDIDTLEWEPRIAESWEISEDKLTFTFHMRKDVRWHDGKPVTAEDVVYSFKTMMDPKVDAPQIRGYYQDCESVTAPDPYTVVFKWKKPYFLSFNFSGGMTILPKHVFDTGEDFNSHPAGRAPLGNGMFRFISWETGERITLERNEDYYREKPHIKNITVFFIPDNNTALLQARSGAVDNMTVQANQWVKDLGADVYREKFNRYYYYSPNYRYIGYNFKRPYFADKRVRRAMTHLVNREAILEHILYGLGKIVTGTFYVDGPDYSAEIEALPYDPAEARRLLDEAGWVDHDGDGIRDKTIDGEVVKFSFSLMYGSQLELSEQIGVLFQEELGKLGIEMNVQRLEWAIFTEKLNEGDFDAVTLGWMLGLEQDPYQLWHSTQVERGSNFISYANAEIDDIIMKARVEFDAEKRRVLYHRFNEIIHEEQPYTFLFCQPELEILDRRFHNVIVHNLGLRMRDWYVPAELQR